MRFLITNNGPIQISSRYGAKEPFRSEPHNGIDFSIPEGTELHSIGDGIIERVVDYGSENIGKGVIVRLEDGTRAIYGHMSDIDVKSGQHVDAGDLIGLSGNTGASTGPHLHFGLWKDGQYVDPTPVQDLVRASIGGGIDEGSKGLLWHAYDLFTGKTSLESVVQEKTSEILSGVLDAVINFTIDASYTIALLGGGICILLRVAGWDKGYKWAGILFVGNVLIRYLLGGVV